MGAVDEKLLSRRAGDSAIAAPGTGDTERDGFLDDAALLILPEEATAAP